MGVNFVIVVIQFTISDVFCQNEGLVGNISQLKIRRIISKVIGEHKNCVNRPLASSLAVVDVLQTTD